eukprot:TCONS_00030205-protein
MGLIKKEGVLYKSPPEVKLMNEKSWHERYFVLADIGRNDALYLRNTKDKSWFHEDVRQRTESYLMYWKNLTEKKKAKEPKGIINLRQCTITTKDVHCFPHKLENLLILSTGKRQYFFSAQNKELQMEWFDFLQSSIDECSNGLIGEDEIDGVFSPPLYQQICEEDFVFEEHDTFICDSSSFSSRDSGRSNGSRTRSGLSNGSLSSRASKDSLSSIEENKRPPNEHKFESCNHTKIQQATGSSRIKEPQDACTQDQNYVYMSSYNDGHYSVPRQPRSRSLGSPNDNETGAFRMENIPGTDYKLVTFMDVKFIVDSNVRLSFNGNSLEIQTKECFCKVEKKETEPSLLLRSSFNIQQTPPKPPRNGSLGESEKPAQLRARPKSMVGVFTASEEICQNNQRSATMCFSPSTKPAPIFKRRVSVNNDHSLSVYQNQYGSTFERNLPNLETSNTIL